MSLHTEAMKFAFKKGYRVSEDGVLLNPNGEPMKLMSAGSRYPFFYVYGFEEKKKRIYVHRFAAYCFYGDEMFKPNIVVRHLNANVFDISSTNIILGTPQDNYFDKDEDVRERVLVEAREKAVAKTRAFNEEQVKEIKRRLLKGEPCTRIARDYGVGRELISKIKNGHKYKEVEL